MAARLNVREDARKFWESLDIHPDRPTLAEFDNQGNPYMIALVRFVHKKAIEAKREDIANVIAGDYPQYFATLT